MKTKILVVDDEKSIREFLQIMLQKEGYEVTCAEDGERALKLVDQKHFDLIMCDLKMPKVDGMKVLQHIRNFHPQKLFIMMTAFATTESAVEAMKLGAYDYLLKPFKIDEVRVNLKQALRSHHLEEENRLLRQELQKQQKTQRLIGNSQAMQNIHELIEKISLSSANVLITGETGTGKEMVARALHYQSKLKTKPFIVVNCGAIPSSLLESELFGHKRGAFTGAILDKKGVFQAADGGSLFLDEIGELHIDMQAKLLRAIQEKSIRPVGAVEDIKVNIRLLAATNRNLEDMVEKETFRQDLYYRLNVIQVHLVPLRERKEDIPLLIQHFMEKNSKKMNKKIPTISGEAMKKIESYSYPGNVRELEHFIERILALTDTNKVLALLSEHLPPVLQNATELSSPESMRSTYKIQFSETKGLDLEKVIGNIEKDLLMKALKISSGIKKKAAELLHINFRAFRYRLKKHSLYLEDTETKDET